MISQHQRSSSAAIVLGMLVCLFGSIAGNAYELPPMLNDIVDVSGDFHDFTNTYFLADHLDSFDPATGEGALTWQRNLYMNRIAFNNMLAVLRPSDGVTFPEGEYAVNPTLPFSLDFVSPQTVRIRLVSGEPTISDDELSLMLVDGAAPSDRSGWTYSRTDNGHRYESAFGSVTVTENPWHIEFHDASGRLLTRTNHTVDNSTTLYPVLPFSFVRRSSDYSRSIAATFELSPGEKIFGCGESPTRLDKHGQKIVLWANDPNGIESQGMYKPIPFFMSDRGYGMFMHTSTPVTCDFGHTFDGTTSLMLGDDQLDLFVFLGSPKEILDEYTTLTGKASMPPLWSFGLWMSRISYFSEQEVREVAANLRRYRIPSDVIHIDTGWFETDWRCDYEFSTSRFDDPAGMLADLKGDGFHVSLWQLPYFVPKNKLFGEVVEKGLVVKNARGNLPFEDAVLDFSNPKTVDWYQDKLANLLHMGVGAIKVDFGEAAPIRGLYHSGRTGFYEHNLYPLRYNKTAADITYEVTGEHIMWARSAWAGSQRYPLHWGGDAANSDTGMAGTLRSGLSLGICGFSFWSHDIGGFAAVTPEELYSRWTPFGMLTSHSRSHGTPPKEPWEFSDEFMNLYRDAAEMKYRLMPYIYAQARDCTERGLPMLRALFIEFPDDPGSWAVEDEYLFGSDILVAPLFEAGTSGRTVYLPQGQWIDYQTGEVYESGWQRIEAGALPVVMLVREGAAIPHIALSQSTADMDWSKLELVAYTADATTASGLVCLPSDNVLHPVTARSGRVADDSLGGKVSWQVTSYRDFRP